MSGYRSEDKDKGKQDEKASTRVDKDQPHVEEVAHPEQPKPLLDEDVYKSVATTDPRQTSVGHTQEEEEKLAKEQPADQKSSEAASKRP